MARLPQEALDHRAAPCVMPRLACFGRSRWRLAPFSPFSRKFSLKAPHVLSTHEARLRSYATYGSRDSPVPDLIHRDQSVDYHCSDSTSTCSGRSAPPGPHPAA